MSQLNKRYDLILVGGGISNISLALKFVGTPYKVLLIELGKDITKRVCPKSNVGECVDCKPCAITSGFSGAIQNYNKERLYA